MVDKNAESSPMEPLRDLDELIAQEEKFRFDSFSQKEAGALAGIMMQKEDEWGRPVAVCIQLNGSTVFQYLPEGTGKLHEQWFKKKIFTVTTLGWSTMRYWAWQHRIGVRRAPSLLAETDLVCCGGGFPIYVNGVGLVGVIVASGLSDQGDHDFIIDCLETLTGKA